MSDPLVPKSIKTVLSVRICQRCNRPLAQHTDYCRAYGRPDVWDTVEMVPLTEVRKALRRAFSTEAHDG